MTSLKFYYDVVHGGLYPYLDYKRIIFCVLALFDIIAVCAVWQTRIAILRWRRLKAKDQAENKPLDNR